MLTATNRVSAVFDSEAQAERAIMDLRQMGVRDAQFSVVARHGETAGVTGTGATGAAVADHGDTAGERIGKGALVGAGVGALFGLAALAIPGVGPFITAGFLAEALGVTGGAAAAGAIVGGTSGAVAGAFARAGYDEHESQFYGSAVERGGVFVAVDTTGGVPTAEQVRQVLANHGGRFATA